MPANSATFPIAGTLQTSGCGTIEMELHNGFETLEQDWRELERDGVCTLYQRYDWIKNWAETVAPPARMVPKIVVGRRKEEILFIFALGTRKRGPFTILTWLGDSHSNFHMGIYSKEFLTNCKPEDTRNLIEVITKNLGRLDILELCCQPVVWDGYTNPFTFLKWQESHNHAFALNLEPDFQSALDRKNGSRKRKKNRWQQNQLAEVGGAKLRIAETPEEIEKLLTSTFEQMGDRLNRAGIWNTFEDDGVDLFMRRLALLSLESNQPILRIYGLEIDGKIRATFAGGIRNGQFSGCFISIAKDEWTRISPGELLIYEVVKSCCEEGLKVLDLGRGEERYKTSWCDTTIPMFETNIALSKRALAFSAYERAKIAAKRVVRNNKTLWGFAKRMRSRFYGRI